MIRVLWLFCALAGLTWGSTSMRQDPTGDASCQPDKLTVYKVVLHTFWSRETFPKHYPDWRPPASWSKVFGENKIVVMLEGLHVKIALWSAIGSLLDGSVIINILIDSSTVTSRKADAFLKVSHQPEEHISRFV
ncbi:unnamed protein product [Ceutorhynchus assimilis]|uniref:Spondin domain-containing protein n=1 Tax=Ceutorhynchus assimilis TaxID=467358 RepID=A0A9N9MXW4_9CUCU|nr:unnamed protein product [Ceutorhynchus assimilis]